MLYKGLTINNTYNIVEEIGHGGMGVVYLAYHIRLEKYVVLKKVKNDIKDIKLIRNEVDILKGLHHPYLPQVYDFFEYEDDIYTVIDYVNGYDLQYYIDSGYRFNEKQLIKWLRQMCEVLRYLHSQTPQILHTDVKPSNIIITKSGDICLIDFGVSLIGKSNLKGFSINYSSPEQYMIAQEYNRSNRIIDKLDERTDVYSLGATFYKLSSLITPDLLNKEQISLSDLGTDYSLAFTEIIDKAMSFDKNKRFSSCSDMLKAVENIYKFDLRYKYYVIIQILSSVLGAFLIVFGIYLIISSVNNNHILDFQTDYSKMIEEYKSGDFQSAENLGLEIVNNKSYDSYVDDNKKAEILHYIGDSYYQEDNYVNASYYYKASIDSSTDNQLILIYYRDYALSLVNEGKLDEAEAVIETCESKSSNSNDINLAKARVLYMRGFCEDSLNLLNQSINSLDYEGKYTAYILKGDILVHLHDYLEAISSYNAIKEYKITISLLRKIGNTYIMYANDQGVNSAYSDALSTFENIIDNYSYSVDDLINYSQSCILTNNSAKYNKCKELLLEYSRDNSQDCRIYMCLSILGDETDDSNVSEYLYLAHNLYNKMSDDERSRISPEFLNKIKNLYSIYIKEKW